MSGESTTKKIVLLGAFDRFNYGDLLFPIVVGNDLRRRHADISISVHGLIESDLSSYGALPTESLRTLNSPESLRDGDVIIFAGGGTIGVDWTYMLQNLLGRRANAALYYAHRILGPTLVDRACRVYFGAKAPFPWVAGPEDFPGSVKVAYNAVGGSEFSNLPPSVQEKTLERLSKAGYLSVRDSESQRLLSPVGKGIPVHLVPDSAVLMSEQFSIHTLEASASSHLLEQTSGAPYICFQANLKYATPLESQIVDALESIYHAYGLRQGGTVLAWIYCLNLRLSSTLDNARSPGYKAPWFPAARERVRESARSRPATRCRRRGGALPGPDGHPSLPGRAAEDRAHPVVCRHLAGPVAGAAELLGGGLEVRRA